MHTSEKCIWSLHARTGAQDPFKPMAESSSRAAPLLMCDTFSCHALIAHLLCLKSSAALSLRGAHTHPVSTVNFTTAMADAIGRTYWPIHDWCLVPLDSYKLGLTASLVRLISLLLVFASQKIVYDVQVCCAVEKVNERQPD